MASAIFSTIPVASVALWLPVAVHAEPATIATDPTSNIGQLLLGFTAVIALLFVSLWVLKRISAPRGQAAGLLRVVAGTAVGTRERVVIVEVGGTWLVLGVAPGQVTTLAEFPRSAIPPQPEKSDQRDFAYWLRRTLKRTDAT